MSLAELASHLNIEETNPAETIRLMAISLGDIASNAEGNSKAMEKAIGNLTLCSMYFCDLHGFDFEDAAWKAAEVERPRQSVNNRNNKNGPLFFKPPSSSNGPRKFQQQQQQQAASFGNNNEDVGLVSPNTTDHFFGNLDDLAEKPRAVIDETALYWVVVLPDGSIREAYPGSRDARVNRNQFNEYYQWAQQFRHGYEIPSRIIPLPPAPNNYDDKHERMLYSPTHFDNDIFSPHNPHDSQLVVRDDRAGSIANEDGATNPASSQSRVNSQSPAPQVYQDASTADRTPVENAFWEKVEKLESHKLSPKEVADLKLTWQFPYIGGRSVQLTQNGNLVAVTEKNKRDFLEKLRQKLAELDAESSRAGANNGSGDALPYPGARRKSQQGLSIPVFGRTASEKKLSVSNPQNPDDVQTMFSPTHDEAGLFAPSADADAHSTIRIDASAPSQSTLPRALQQDAPSSKAKASPTFPHQPVAAPQYNNNNSAAFASKILEGDFFISAMTSIHENPSSVDRYGVTFCMPYPIDSPVAVKDLVPNGRNIHVSASDVPRYLSMLRENM